MKKIFTLFATLMMVLSVSAANKTIYCKMAHDWWTTGDETGPAAIGAYYWNPEAAPVWPGVRMTLVEGETDVWSIDLDTDLYKNIIFTRVNSSGAVADWGAKTGDLTIPTDSKNLYTITSSTAVWGDPGVEGVWSEYVPGAPKTYKDITITITAPSTPKIHYWGGGDKVVGTDWDTKPDMQPTGQPNTYYFLIKDVDESLGINYLIVVGDVQTPDRHTMEDVNKDLKELFPKVVVRGVNSWEEQDVMTVSDDYLTASITLELQAEYEYMIKLTVDGVWFGSEAVNITKDNNQAVLEKDGWGDGKLTTEHAGEYVLTYTYATNTLVVTYPVPVYTINAVVDPIIDPMGEIKVDGAGEYKHGEQVTVSAPIIPGYTFSYWESDLLSPSDQWVYIFTAEADCNLVAKYDPIEYKVQAYAFDDEMGSAGANAETYYYGETVELSATPEPGYKFVKWVDAEDNFVSDDPYYSFVIDDPYMPTEYVFKAHFERIKYNIHTSVNPENAGVVNVEGDGAENTDVILTAVPAEGYIFTGWNIGSLDNPLVFENVTEDIEVIANFVRAIYKITAEVDPNVDPEGLKIVEGVGEYEHGDPVSLSAPIIDGYKFIGWEEELTIISESMVLNFSASADRHLVAKYERIEYKVQAYAYDDEMGSAGANAETYYYGETVELSATPEPGYKFVKWVDAEDEFVSDNPYYSFVIDDPYMPTEYVFKAHFELITYKLIATAVDDERVPYEHNDWGTIEGTGTLVPGEYEVTIVPSEAYEFLRWENMHKKVLSDEETLKINLESDTAIIAVVTPKIHQLIIECTAGSESFGGTITGDLVFDPFAGSGAQGINYIKHGTQLLLSATPFEGYEFVNWTIEGAEISTDATFTYTVTADVTLVANFKIKEYVVNVYPNMPEYGEVNVSGLIEDGVVKHGTTLDLLATPKSGYHFVCWQIGGVEYSKDNPLSYEVLDDVNIVAVFQSNTTTALDNVNASDAPVKTLMDGCVYIIRNGKVYTVMGNEVK